jgi:hypothetical protein
LHPYVAGRHDWHADEGDVTAERAVFPDLTVPLEEDPTVHEPITRVDAHGWAVATSIP